MTKIINNNVILSFFSFQEKAQSLQNSHRSASTENRSMSPDVGTLGPPTPPSSTKKLITSPVIVIE